MIESCRCTRGGDEQSDATAGIEGRIHSRGHRDAESTAGESGTCEGRQQHEQAQLAQPPAAELCLMEATALVELLRTKKVSPFEGNSNDFWIPAAQGRY